MSGENAELIAEVRGMHHRHYTGVCVLDDAPWPCAASRAADALAAADAEIARLRADIGAIIGEYGTRYTAKHRRAFKGGPILLLCSRHQMVWRAKDEKDSGGAP